MTQESPDRLPNVPLVVFFHGAFQSADIWKKVTASIQTISDTVVVNVSSTSCLDKIVEDVDNAIEMRNYSAVVFVGISLGCIIASLVAERTKHVSRTGVMAIAPPANVRPYQVAAIQRLLPVIAPIINLLPQRFSRKVWSTPDQMNLLSLISAPPKAVLSKKVAVCIVITKFDLFSGSRGQQLSFCKLLLSDQNRENFIFSALTHHPLLFFPHRISKILQSFLENLTSHD